jgi:GT2 family glycosyltransferase
MALDVVVVNYHTDHLLEEFVDSYAQNAWEGCTLFGVSVQTDKLPRSKYHYRAIATSENIGYAKACNLGASKGDNDVILLANADTVLTDGLKECHDALMANPDWGILGPRQVNEQNLITAGGIFGTETSIGQRGWNQGDVGQYSAVEEAMSVSGSLYFIKRAVWDELTNCSFMQAMFPGIKGAFIPTQHYYEETCCSYHARHHGYKCIYYGPVKMIHYWHKASVHGGYADQQVDASKQLMREFLHSHSIVCE